MPEAVRFIIDLLFVLKPFLEGRGIHLAFGLFKLLIRT